jgi:hypothetical protein
MKQDTIADLIARLEEMRDQQFLEEMADHKLVLDYITNEIKLYHRIIRNVTPEYIDTIKQQLDELEHHNYNLSSIINALLDLNVTEEFKQYFKLQKKDSDAIKQKRALYYQQHKERIKAYNLQRYYTNKQQ